MVKRYLQKTLQEQCFKGKAIILLGARQVGKTTLLKQLIQTIQCPYIWLNTDEADVFHELSNANTSTGLLQIIGPKNKLVIIDEAQQIPDIGKKIKLIYDQFPDIQVIATGSSAFDLRNQTSESLTGRKREFYLFPLSMQELSEHQSEQEEKRLLSTRLVYGSYPEVINNPGKEKEVLVEIARSYLYKDVLQLDGIRKSSLLEKLLQLIAHQIGNEVHYNELATSIGNINSVSVEKYLDILEKAFVIYKLPALNRNFRNEIKKGKKYYFYDNGIRNTLIAGFQSLGLRNDIGALWENYLLGERIKMLEYKQIYAHKYFWRTKDQAEIDYIEEKNGKMNAFELKWNSNKLRIPKSFLQSYPHSDTSLIHSTNYIPFTRGESNF